MLLPLPEMLLGRVNYKDNEWILAENATAEEEVAFEKFVQEFEERGGWQGFMGERDDEFMAGFGADSE